MEVPQIDIRETGKNIRRMRTERGIRVTEISDALMIDKQAVYRWEYGKASRSWKTAWRLPACFTQRLKTS